MTPRTLLVADVNPQTARRVQECLRGNAVEVRAVASVEDAEHAVDASDIALVLAAVSFPRGNGYDLSRSIRDRDPRCAVCLLTSPFDVYQPERAAAAGVAARLSQPLGAEALRALVTDLMGPMEPSAPLAAFPSVGDERVASFLPRDYQRYPAVRVDPAVVAPALERAIVELLPQVVESVLYNALRTSPELRARITEVIAEVVREERAAERRGPG
jgi:DNA-binding NarL/FixJ family response regulator